MEDTQASIASDFQHCVVQGACGGIGRATVEWLVANTQAHISATCRHDSPCTQLQPIATQHHRVRPVSLDVTSDASIIAAWQQISNHQPPVDCLINASGLLHDGDRAPEKRLEDLNGDTLKELFAVNATGPAVVVAKGMNCFARSRRVVIANVSARVGSISDNRLGGWYSYRASKAALNMLTRTLSIELTRRLPQSVCLAYHPGTVATRLSAPFQAKVPQGQLFTPPMAAAYLMDLVTRVTPQDSGGFFAWDGKPIDW